MEDVSPIITPHARKLRDVHAHHETRTGEIVKAHIDNINAGYASDIAGVIDDTTAQAFELFTDTADAVEAQIRQGALEIDELARHNSHLARLLHVVKKAQSEGASPEVIIRGLPRDTRQRKLAAIAVGICLDSEALGAAQSLAHRGATRQAVQRVIGKQVSVGGVVDTAIHAHLDIIRLEHVTSGNQNLRDTHARIKEQASSSVIEPLLLAAFDRHLLYAATERVRSGTPANEAILQIVTPLATPAVKPHLQAAVFGEEARQLTEQDATIKALQHRIQQYASRLTKLPLPIPTGIDPDAYTIALRDSGMLDASGVVNFIQASLPTGQSQIFRTPNGEQYSASECAEVLHTSQGLLIRIGGVVEGIVGYPAVPTGTAHYIYPDSGITYSTPGGTRVSEIGHTRIAAEPATIAQLEVVIAYLSHLDSKD